MARFLFAVVLGVAACGGGKARPGPNSPSGAAAPLDPAVPVDCTGACARLRECGRSEPACETDCGGAATDDLTRSRWACWSSSQTCAELEECDATGE